MSVRADDVREPHVLTRDQCERLAERIFAAVAAPEMELELQSTASASTSFALGDAHVATSNATVRATLRADYGETGCGVTTNRLDDAALAALAAKVAAAAKQQRSRGNVMQARGPQTYPTPPRLFFDETLPAMAPEARSALFRSATDATEAAGLIGAGDLQLELSSQAVMSTGGLFAYSSGSYGEFSLTARTRDGSGSGWAWSGFEDWARVDPNAAIARAVDLAQRSAKPVAVEPGRYTVILEPAAVAALVQPMLDQWSASWADAGFTVFSKDPVGTNKLGLQMMDRRLWMVSDPWDPDKPTKTFDGNGNPIPEKVVWFERGVLKNLAYEAEYARLKGKAPVTNPGGARLYAEGPTASLEAMIASTPRGILVNRLSHVIVMHGKTLLLSGTTRDGTFLIENGKITKAIKNFRFTESPFFVLNKLEAAGEPVRASRSVVVPRLKLRDFNFTSLTEAV